MRNNDMQPRLTISRWQGPPSLRELRQKPVTLIDALEEREDIVITRRNRPITDLVPRRPGAGT
ncbi:MAG: hypothetical protein QM635_01880 [Microbacteriaceae bacterium]